ncbi:MAG UNVERIFIED_CONTAM: sigma-70 family RNA polymerase sigma factor [Anaerolineae bacterium]
MRLFNRKPNQVNLKSLNDVELVTLAKENKDAFGELYERYVDKIYRYIYYRVGNSEDAEDLTSRVFFRAMAHVEHYEDRGLPFQAWLYRIAHNLVANHHRDKERRKVIPLNEYIANQLFSSDPEHKTVEKQESERLKAVVHQLPEERQQLLLLKFVHHLSNAEIGEIMGKTEGAIKSLYHRTLLVLRDQLTEETPESERLAN